MSQEPIILGSLVELTVSFTNQEDAAEDPTTVICIILKPNGTRESPPPTRDSTGNWSVLLTADAPGRWAYRFAGTGTLIAAAEGKFQVANGLA